MLYWGVSTLDGVIMMGTMGIVLNERKVMDSPTLSINLLLTRKLQLLQDSPTQAEERKLITYSRPVTPYIASASYSHRMYSFYQTIFHF